MAVGVIALFTIFGVTCSASNDEGGSGGLTGPGTPGAPGPFDFLVGTWVGTWTDTRFGVSGAVRCTIAVNGNRVTADGTIDLSALGLGDEAGTAEGTITGNNLAFTFTADTVGSGEGTLSNGGAGSGTGTVTGMLNFGDFTFEGTVDPTTIQGTFQFTAPSGGRGTVELTKQ